MATDCVFPDYRGGSIVNLMCSITGAYGWSCPDYPALQGLAADQLAETENLVLLVVDGLGYDYLIRYGSGSVLHQHLQRSITSVAPPTTATAVTTFLTGLAPQQHGLTGWFTWFRELGSVLAVLPFKPRCSNEALGRSGVYAESLFGHIPVFDRIQVNSYSLCPDWLAASDFNRAHLGQAELVAFRDLGDCFARITQIVRTQQRRKYVYAYWPGFDQLAHMEGVSSEQTHQHFVELDAHFARLIDDLSASGTTIIVTADHGFVDIAEQHRIELDAHPLMKDCLSIPLCGEQRLSYAYVRHEKREQFESYIDQYLSHAIELNRSEQLLRRDLFGLGSPHPELQSRIGDYILIMKAGYVMHDPIPGEKPSRMIGFHGGLSQQEMLVPLISVSL
jgi:predicted AlkP superfamily pyrophosphatase or phosphodiesterase